MINNRLGIELSQPTAAPIVNEAVCGGKVDYSDPTAPKAIESKDITSFSTYFFRYNDYDGGGAGYSFKAEKNSVGTVTVSAGSGDDACISDASFMEKLQKIIEDNNLVIANGKNTHTSGLPAEFQPCYLNADYASGEHLYFSVNNDPRGQWQSAVYYCFAEEFGSHGNNKYLPPEETRQIKRLQLEYLKDGILNEYYELDVPNEGVHKSLEDLATNGYADGEFYTVFQRLIISKPDNSERSDDRAVFSDELYIGASEVLKSIDLRPYNNLTTIPHNYNYDSAESYFSFYIEFKCGNTIYGFSDVPKSTSAFLETVQPLLDFLNEYIDKNLTER